MSRYAIIGAGRQGIAVSYYLARFCGARQITFLDESPSQALNAAVTARKIIKESGCRADISYFDMKTLRQNISSLKSYDVVIAALPSEHLLEIATIAAELGVSYCDYGPDTNVIRAQLELDGLARKNGATLVVNNGIGPGLNNIIAVGASREFDCDTIKVYVGGIPQDQFCNAIGYQSAFANVLDGYVGEATVLENGELKKIPLPGGFEMFVFQEYGTCWLEAFLTDVGTKLTVELLQKEGRVKNFFEKTLRWSGHFKFLRQLDCVGFLQTQKIQMGKVSVSPFEVARQCFDNMPRVKEDILAFFMYFEKDKKEVARVKMVVRYNPILGLTAMQQATSSNTAIIASLLAQKKFPSGVFLPEDIINRKLGWRFVVSELQSMGLPISIVEKIPR